MSKKAQKLTKRVVESEISDKTSESTVKLKDRCILDIVINTRILKRWSTLKAAYCIEPDGDFLTKLLDLAQEHLSRKSEGLCQNNGSQKENKAEDNKCKKSKQKKVLQIKKDRNEGKITKVPVSLEDQNDKIASNEIQNINNLISDNIIVKQDTNNKKTEKYVTDGNASQLSFNNYSILEASLTRNMINQNYDLQNSNTSSENQDGNNNKKKKQLQNTIEKSSKKEKISEIKKELESDMRKIPTLENQTDVTLDTKSERNESDNKGGSFKICITCNTQHIQDKCPVYFPDHFIQDFISHSEWLDKYQMIHENMNSESVKNEKEQENASDESDKYSFSKMTLPSVLYLDNADASHGLSVFCKGDLEEFTQFGPLIGKVTKEVDISEDSSMKDIWEISSDNGCTYISTEDDTSSNWIKYIRPAPTRDGRNVAVVIKDNNLYFVTIKALKAGEELLFWQDSSVTTNKKRLEKTSCGGCNMVFKHPLYYRTHCSVFHDLRYSLTIRKYHCKVCGAAVLGKENIMKHAAELHNGQGAYQCQFCKKFFLRLNYLEMHRTYGCSANPHRSRPLCDFCGRKFCQPQKLKVHIKRMHSDFSEVLKEFQCKSCLKILGSRAALQRHSKEVHQKQVDNTCSCIRCGKHFQNKSNLKIHMLTHSGIKPFKCTVLSCAAAFTTKQCLQFHYKKVHNLTEDAMPKIERSVNYTFEAYSGLNDKEKSKDDKNNIQTDSTAATLDEGSDFDENSMDSKTLDDPPAIQSPLQLTNTQSPPPSPPPVDTYITSVGTGMKILSKGSKKWIGDEPLQTQPLRSDLYQVDQNHLNKDDLSNLSLQVQESHIYDRTKLNTNLNTFARHESSNASLLVEAALDSVCSEPNIDIDVSSTTNCTDSLVNNLYTLAPNDGLPDVSYSESVCMNEPRDINLISPSVNDHISVTDELNDELQQNQSMGMDYSSFHQEEFSPANSPGIHQRNTFVRNYINSLSPSNQNYNNPQKSMSPVPSPPRYDFGHAVNTEHLSSDDSNGMSAQNLSLHNPKSDIQLDLSIYKSSYKLDPPSFQPRKDFRLRFDNESDRKQVYLVGVEGSKNYQSENVIEQNQVENLNGSNMSSSMQNIDVEKEKQSEDNDRPKYPDDLSHDLRHKFDLDLDLRIKTYEPIDSETLRSKNSYDSQSELDFRSKNYDLMDSIENRNKVYESAIDSEFRTDRNFEPLVLNSSELQGLDMSARSFHNYPNINRYHHLYPDVDRVDLRLNYSPPPPAYTHADILRVVSLDLTPPGRHSVDLSLRSHPLHQIANSRLLSDHTIQSNSHRLLDQTRLLSSDLATARHLTGESRLLSESSGRILSDHTTNRILSNNDQLTSNHLLTSDQPRLLSEDSRLISDQSRLLEQSRLITDARILPPTTPSGSVSPVPTFAGYSVSQSPYHPTPLAPRTHVTSPTPSPYHHYAAYY